MDSSVSAALVTNLTTFADTATDQLVAMLPIALPVLAGIAGTFFAIKIVRGMLHM